MKKKKELDLAAVGLALLLIGVVFALLTACYFNYCISWEATF